MRVEYAEISLIGSRERNEDRVAVAVAEEAALLLVADGMGGHADGARAAELTQKTLIEAFWHTPLPAFDPIGFLHLTLGAAHEAVVSYGRDRPMEQRPRATCAVCLVQRGNAYWSHVGDSRVYLIRGGAIVARTRDHSHVENLLREGVIVPAQAAAHPMRNFVESCIGGETLLPQMSTSGRRKLEPGDVLLACTDGLWGSLKDEDVAASFATTDIALAKQLGGLAKRAVEANGASSDNTSAVVMRWLGP
ncbi:MAG: PP2C family serine/threonine-protein phosphatase [Steroidobacteraceae bacterium]